MCTIGDTTSCLGQRASVRARRARKLPEALAATGAPHRWFAGVVERAHWNRFGRAFFALTGGRYGDHRDWHDIDDWTSGIARSLAAATPAA